MKDAGRKAVGMRPVRPRAMLADRALSGSTLEARQHVLLVVGEAHENFGG